jgi:hypothetical protein
MRYPVIELAEKLVKKGFVSFGFLAPADGWQSTAELVEAERYVTRLLAVKAHAGDRLEQPETDTVLAPWIVVDPVEFRYVGSVSGRTLRDAVRNSETVYPGMAVLPRSVFK